MVEKDRSGAQPVIHHAGASVRVDLDWDTLEPGAQVSFLERSPTACLSEDDKLAWERAALHGVRYALKAARAQPCMARIQGVAGDPEHTTSTLVAAAVAHAVWDALEFTPAPEIMASVERAVRLSHGAAPRVLHPFGI